MSGSIGLKAKVAFTASFAATIAYGGFWDVVNKVQRTVDAVNTVVNGPQQQQPAPVAPAAPAAASAPAPAPVAPAAPVVAQPAMPVAAPVAAPAAPAAPAVPTVSAAPAAPAIPTVDKSAAAAFAAQCTTATDTAVPSVGSGVVTFKKPATPAQIKEARDAFVSGGREISDASLVFEKDVDDATVAAGIAAFPEAWRVTVKEAKLTTLAPFVLLGGVRSISLSHVKCADMKPLAACAELCAIELKYCDISDLSGLGALQSLTSVNLYGSKMTCSFAPLASCSSLDTIDFYAVKAPKETYDSLGALRQVKEFKGGLTKMTSLKWLLNCPQAEVLEVFSEKIDDFSPISSLPNLVRFRGWNMDGGRMATALGDLSFLANCKKLQKLELPGSAYSNTALIGTFTELEELDLSNAKQPVDVSFVKSLKKLTRISLNGTEVVNGQAIPPSVKIRSDKKTKGL